jgi:hypothetical protein
MAFDRRGVTSIRSYSATLCLKYSKSHNSYKFLSIQKGVTAGSSTCHDKQSYQIWTNSVIRVMTNNPTKYEQILSYGSWQTILPNMNKFCHTGHDKQSYQIWKNSVIRVMTNNPTKYEQILSYGFRGVAFTNYHGRTDGCRLPYYYVTPSRSAGGQKTL